jgi:3-oxoacyl-[acyl-carrier protein] reductase
MDLGLKGKVALVGGSSEGIGYAVARLLAAEGAKVAMVARRSEPLEAAARRVKEETGSATFAIPADIRKAADCERMVAACAEHFGRLDILVNNDGAPPLGTIESFDDNAWAKAVEQNFMSVVRLTRHALPHLRKSGAGRIVNVTSLSVLQPLKEFGLSVATWAGVLGHAKTLSLEVAADGITVNTLCPGRIATGRLAKVFGIGGEIDAARMAEIARDIPVGRLGTPEEIAGFVAFLASPYAAYITGCVFHIDGGRGASLA